MLKNIIISIDSYSDLENKDDYFDWINELAEEGRIIVFVARDDNRKQELTPKLGYKWHKNVKYSNRQKLRDNINNSKIEINSFIVVGNKDKDMQFAATNKLFYINPKWCKDIQFGAAKYGMPVRNLNGLKKAIKIIENQNNWFFELDVDDKTKVLSLMSANDLGVHSEEELELIRGFRNFLKAGDYRYYSVLLYHFLAGISNRKEFREIQDWAIVPSSGTELNNEMWLFKERARWLMNGRKPEALFKRHTQTLKSHESYKNGVDRIPCDRHFDTIILNEKYKGKLRNRVVCIFDDYSTNGTSFEVVRNLLLKEGVKKIYCVSLGKFGYDRQPFYYQNYELTGNLFDKGYQYRLISRENINYKASINRDALTEIEKLYNIIYG